MFATVLGDVEDAVGRLFESRSGCGWKLNKKTYRENGDLCSEIAIRAFPCQISWTKLWIEGSKLWIAPALPCQSRESPFPPARKSWIAGEVGSCEWRSLGWGWLCTVLVFWPHSRFTVGARTAISSHHFAWDPKGKGFLRYQTNINKLPWL